MNPTDKLLRLKKAKFIVVVERTAKHLKVPVPNVKFHECPDSTEDDQAHIHPDLNIICISEKNLSEMTFEEIEETASHEVEHLRDTQPEITPVHSPDFYERYEKTRRETWRPEHPGVVITRGNEKVVKTGESKPFKPDDTTCNNYQICNTRTGLKQCSLCKKFFCKDHILPYEPHVGTGRLDLEYSSDGHPCPDYATLPNSEKIKFKTELIARENYEKALSEWEIQIKKIKQENERLKNGWEKKHREWTKECDFLCKEYVKTVKKWKDDCRKIEKEYLEEKERLEKEYKKSLRAWENKCKVIEKDNENRFKKWEEDCDKSAFAFIKKIFKINKPRVLGLPEKPSKREPEKVLPKKPKVDLPPEPQQPVYLELTSKPEFDMLKYQFG